MGSTITGGGQITCPGGGAPPACEAGFLKPSIEVPNPVHLYSRLPFMRCRKRLAPHRNKLY